MSSGKTKYLYILSQRYSGSTLLSFLLGLHPDISTIGERRKFYNKAIRTDEDPAMRCSCGNTFQDCPHWSAIKSGVLEKMGQDTLKTNSTEFEWVFSKHLNHLITRVLRYCILNNIPRSFRPFAKTLEKHCHFNRLLVEETLQLDGKHVFLDSSKVINHIVFLSRIKAFDFYIIWLSRDPRAQVHSARKYNNWTIAEAARKWQREMELNERILKKMGLPYLPLQYERLCRDPKKEIARILDFAGLDKSKISLDFRQQQQHIMGNYNMRMGTDTTIVERKEWQEQLDDLQIKTIEKLTAPYQQYYASDEL